MYSQESVRKAHDDTIMRDAVGTPIELDTNLMRCPECLGELGAYGDVVHCLQCGAEWAIIGNIPWLARGDQHYHADVPETLMRQLISEALNDSWLSAFANLLGVLPQSRRDLLRGNVLDPARALGLSILPLEKDHKALDIGCGWGTLSIPLASRVGTVVALDLSPLRARFTQLRATQEGIENLTIIGGGDTVYLPFGADHFDAVILNGVLEWTAASRPGKPSDVHQDYLTEVRRVLKPGGRILIGIENRISFHYLCGIPEDHVSLRFVSLMPRPIADVYCRLRRGIPYRNHTYTLWGYRKLLNRAGYSSIRFYYPHPNYRMPTKVVPLRDSRALQTAFPMESKSRLKQMAVRVGLGSGLFRAIAPSYLIIAQKAR